MAPVHIINREKRPEIGTDGVSLLRIGEAIAIRVHTERVALNCIL